MPSRSLGDMLGAHERESGGPTRPRRSRARANLLNRINVICPVQSSVQKTIACGNAGCSGVLDSCAFYQCKVHTRPRVQWAPGIPHALQRGREINAQLGRTARRDRERVSEIGVPSLRAKRSNPWPQQKGSMDCFASLAMTVSTAPHSQPSSPVKAGDPVFRDANDGAEKPRHTGYPAFAGYDGRRLGKAQRAHHHRRQ